MLILAILTIMSAQDTSADITGFRGFEWGTPYSEMSEGMIKSSSMNPGFKGYEKPDDDMIYAGIEAHTIIYLFKKDKFNCISVGYYNNQVDSVVANLTELYGEPEYIVTPFVTNYEWYFPSSIMVLSYITINDSDKSVALGIRKPK